MVRMSLKLVFILTLSKEIQVLSRASPLKEFLRYRDLQGQDKTISFETEAGWKRSSAPISGINDFPVEFFDQSVNW